MLAALALAGVALVALLLRFASAPTPSPSAALPPEAPAQEAGPGPEHAPVVPSPAAAPAEAPAPAADTTPVDHGLPGTLEVFLTGWPAGAAEEALVVASRWRSHPAAEVETVGRLVIPAGTDRGQLQLPSGSYALQARTAGRASAPLRVDLAEPLLRMEVVLTLSGCARLVGFVVRESGDPVQDLAVHLIDGSGQLVDSGLTTFGGRFELPCVPFGSWWLVVGAVEGPLLGPRQVFVDTGGAGLGNLVLPPLGAVEILVRDETGAPVPDLELSGLGGTGGRLLLSTDFDGRAASELALPGTWRFFGDSGPLGRGNAVLEVEAGGRAQATLTLRRPR